MYPYNHKMGQKIQTDIDGVEADRGFLAHFQVAADDAAAASVTAILAATALTTEAQAIVEDITNPAVPRSVTAKGSASGITGDVVITGTNAAGEEITETLALNGATAVEGNKAFATITQVDLPVESHEGTDTVSIGTGTKLGLPWLLSHNTVLVAYLDNAKEGTAPTVTVSATAIESNTIKLSSALGGKGRRRVFDRLRRCGYVSAEASQFNTIIRLKHRIDHAINGAPDPTYQDATPAVHYCAFKVILRSGGDPRRAAGDHRGRYHHHVVHRRGQAERPNLAQRRCRSRLRGH